MAYYVHITNGEGSFKFGPFATKEDAHAESYRWVCTGGCTENRIDDDTAGFDATPETVSPAVVVPPQE